MLKGQKETERSGVNIPPFFWNGSHSEAVTEFKQASLKPTVVCRVVGRAWQFRSCWPIFILLKLGLIVSTVDAYAAGLKKKK